MTRCPDCKKNRKQTWQTNEFSVDGISINICKYCFIRWMRIYEDRYQKGRLF